VLSNNSGPSDGINGDGQKVGGVRVDLGLLCGIDNARCVVNTDGSLRLDELGHVQFDVAAAGMTLGEFLQTPDGLKMSGPTGGIQGSVGTLFGKPYAPGSWQDKLIEAFAGPHDFIGGHLSGLYDAQGNIKQNMTEAERFIYNNLVTIGAIPVAAPFALMQAVPAPIWQDALIVIEGKAAK
jgi:filamentous hemagglutinin